MSVNSVIQLDHFVIFSFDRSCKGGITNNFVFYIFEITYLASGTFGYI